MPNYVPPLEIDTRYLVRPREIIIHKNLPKCPFYLTLIGGKGSGKTLLIVNVVHKFKKVFKKSKLLFLQVHM
jgi:hypothetical protein